MNSIPRRLRQLSLIALASLALSACKGADSDLSKESVVRTPEHQSELDKYIEEQFSRPYNIEVLYRYREYEIGRGWVTSPARAENSLQFVNVLRYLFLEPYVETTSKDFVRQFSPQALILTGYYGYNPPPSNTYTLASTINGIKIVFMDINHLDFPTLKALYAEREALQGKTDAASVARYNELDAQIKKTNQSYITTLRTSYLRTIYHESAHTFHQRVEPTTDFDKITSLDYKGGTWTTWWTRNGKRSIQYGFISNYASQEPHEDFAELFAHYIILTPEEWAAKMQEADVIPSGASSSGKVLIERKLAIIKEYMTRQWGLDMDLLRSNVQKRYPEFARQDFTIIH